jgi:hypothetical protein
MSLVAGVQDAIQVLLSVSVRKSQHGTIGKGEEKSIKSFKKCRIISH